MQSTPVVLLDAEFKALCPNLTPAEAEALRESLIAEGCRDAITYWPSIEATPCPRGGNHEPDEDGECSKCREPAANLIVDGHNRYCICTNEGLPFPVRQMHFSDRDAVKVWMYRAQLGRRNLNEAQRSLLRGKLQNLLKADKDSNLRQNAAKTGTLPKSQNDTSGKRGDFAAFLPLEGADAATQIAEEYGVSRATVFRDSKAATAVDKITAAAPALREAFENGTVPLSTAADLAEAPTADLQKLERLEGPELKAAAKDTAAKVREATRTKRATSTNGKPASSRAPWKEVDDLIGKAINRLDAINDACPHAVHHRQINRELNDAIRHLNEWKAAVRP